MEIQQPKKSSNVLQVILVVIIVILITIVFAQNRYINMLKHVKSENILSENTHEDFKMEKKLSGDNLPQEDISVYKAKIKKLESQIADMQEWQDYLEKERNVNNPVDNDPSTNKSDMFVVESSPMDNSSSYKRYLTSRYESFTKENNLSPEMSKKFIDLLAEKQAALSKLAPNIEDIRSGNVLPEEILKVEEEINSEYDEKLSELLSNDEYAALKDYEKYEQERQIVDQLTQTGLYGGMQLEKEQKKELIAAMYNDRQDLGLTQKEMQERIISRGEPLNEESMRNQIKDSLESQIKLYSQHIETAKNILSESQMKKFESYIVMRQRSLENMIKRLPEMEIFGDSNKKEE